MNDNRMKHVMLGFQAEPRLKDELDQIAKDLERTRSWVMTRAIEEYLSRNRWDRNRGTHE